MTEAPFLSPQHVPQELRESAEFAHARIDALQALLATHFATVARFAVPIEYFLKVFQDGDNELVEKWPEIQAAIRARES